MCVCVCGGGGGGGGVEATTYDRAAFHCLAIMFAHACFMGPSPVGSKIFEYLVSQIHDWNRKKI